MQETEKFADIINRIGPIELGQELVPIWTILEQY